jgi:RNA polymerase sigma-70 factor (sigma-E family)
MTAWQSLFDELVSRRYPYLVGYALLLTGNRPDAEDLVHDALVSTFGKRRKLANAGAAEGYVRRAIASRYIDKGRKREREKRAYTRAAGGDDRGVRPMDVDVADRTALGEALQTLPPRERAAVTLRYVDGLSTAETAATLGISDGAVKRYVHDAVNALNSALGTTDQPDNAIYAPVTDGRG